jgi:DNA replication protein DnaT
MAGHWIPWEIGLQQKSEVARMARGCGVHPHEMAARCMIVWAWAQDQTVNGLIEGMTPEDLSCTIGLPGMGEAMVSVGWLSDIGDGILFPNWERFNGRPSKARMLAAERKRRQRSR